jgi:hypothetical protein
MTTLTTKATSGNSRETFETSRELDFLSEKELTAQIGHQRRAWPLVLIQRGREVWLLKTQYLSEELFIPRGSLLLSFDAVG